MQTDSWVGRTHRTRFKVDESIIGRFAELSGDENPIHVDQKEARAYGYPRQVAHGAVLVAFLSRVIGMEIPGPGAVWMSQSIDWVRPVFAGDEIEIAVTVESFSRATGVLSLNVVANNQGGQTVMQGTAQVKATEKLTGSNRPDGPTTRVALVTGGSRGIGAEIARRLGAAGTIVAVNYLNSRDGAEHAVEEIRSAGGSAEAFAADVSNPAETSNMVSEVVRRFGRLDVIVHGATPNISEKDVAELSYCEIEPYLNVFLGGALTLVAAASPGMKERKFGRFIFLGTTFMFGVPPAGLAAYVTAKQALWGLVRCLAAELGRAGITSNMVSPGMTVTDLTANVSARVKEVQARQNPMRRLAAAQDTAELVAFVASEGAGYINGANLPVTGGPV